MLTIVGSAGLLVLPSAALAWAILAGIGTTCALQVSLTGPPELAPPERVGATAGAMLTIGYVGAVIGPFAIGALHDLSGDFAAGLLLVVAIGVVLTLAGLRVPASTNARIGQSSGAGSRNRRSTFSVMRDTLLSVPFQPRLPSQLMLPTENTPPPAALAK